MTCETCNGTGFVQTEDNLMRMPENWEFCPDCVEQGICPKCKLPLSWDAADEVYKCHYCGWEG